MRSLAIFAFHRDERAAAHAPQRTSTLWIEEHELGRRHLVTVRKRLRGADPWRDFLFPEHGGATRA